jgi:hypothetical protein
MELVEVRKEVEIMDQFIVSKLPFLLSSIRCCITRRLVVKKCDLHTK